MFMSFRSKANLFIRLLLSSFLDYTVARPLAYYIFTNRYESSTDSFNTWNVVRNSECDKKNVSPNVRILHNIYNAML